MTNLLLPWLQDNSGFDLTTLPAARAGLISYIQALLKDKIETERLSPLVSQGIPLCSAQFERTFGTTRIPGLEAGELGEGGRRWEEMGGGKEMGGGEEGRR